MNCADLIIEQIITAGNERYLFCRNDEETVIPFPLKKPFVTFSVIEDNVENLLGDGSSICTEIINVTVRTNETEGEGSCRKSAEEVCIEIMKADKKKMIISVNAGKCEFEEDSLCYAVNLQLRLRTVRKSLS